MLKSTKCQASEQKIQQARLSLQIAKAMRNVRAKNTGPDDLKGQMTLAAADAIVEENKLYLLALRMNLR